mmetsp:Transcript_45901/g.109320  ORF Transcript_45901/g.109320 Transcript_45901/m.109320 type:complete len:555 (-) Transcript_45901:53-1717(-)
MLRRTHSAGSDAHTNSVSNSHSGFHHFGLPQMAQSISNAASRVRRASFSQRSAESGMWAFPSHISGLRRMGSMGSRTSSEKSTVLSRWIFRPSTSTPEERMVLGVMIFFFAWLLLASAALMLNSIFYHSTVVDEARARYLWTCAERAARQAEAVLSVALLVRNALHYSVSRQLYYDPLDYQAARAAVEPVFLATPSLRSVELAFTDRAESISFIRQYRRPPTTASELIMQSDAEDCATLGPLGCSPEMPARERPWFDASLELRNWHDASDAKDYYYYSYYSVETASRGFMWLDEPSFLPYVNIVSNGTRQEEVVHQDGMAWTTASSLVFRAIFPGTSRHVSVLGHAVVESSGLRTTFDLRDEATLGSQGGIFICDRAGNMVAVHDSGGQVLKESGSGTIRFRHLSELTEDWASALHTKLSRSAMQTGRTHALAEGFDVVSVPLPSSQLAHFTVVVAAQRDPFVDGALEGMTNVAYTVVWLPIPFVALVFAIWCGHREVGRRRKQKRVQVVEEALATLRAAEKQGVAPDPRMIRFTRIFEETPASPTLPKRHLWG